MDTDAIVAALRSPRGASAALVRRARQEMVTLVATVPLFVEYEAVCCRPEHVAASGLSRSEVGIFLDGLASLMGAAEVWFLWRPQLRDPGDELVLEAAVNGRADAIATFNQRDFRRSAIRFGVDILLPAEALRRVA